MSKTTESSIIPLGSPLDDQWLKDRKSKKTPPIQPKSFSPPNIKAKRLEMSRKISKKPTVLRYNDHFQIVITPMMDECKPIDQDVLVDLEDYQKMITAFKAKTRHTAEVQTATHKQLVVNVDTYVDELSGQIRTKSNLKPEVIRFVIRKSLMKHIKSYPTLLKSSIYSIKINVIEKYV